MIKKSKTADSIGFALILVFCATILLLPVQAEAESKVVTLEGVSYNVNYTLVDNLKLFVGKKVSVTLDSGKTFSGIVKEVGTHLIHLEKLDGKEYFDALLRIENISAIDTRFRNIVR